MLRGFKSSRFVFTALFVLLANSLSSAQDLSSKTTRSEETAKAEANGDASTPQPKRKVRGWALENRGYYEPLIAEPRAATVSVLFPARSDEFPFSQKPGDRVVWDITLGKELPIFGWEVGNTEPETIMAKGDWGFGLWVPISFHMIEEFKDDSNPIVNTDYRFSGMLKYQRGIAEELRLGLRFQFGHESTHLGDEFSLAARRTKPDFERINVSYEYWEYGVSLEKDKDNHYFFFRHGGIGLWKPGKGFYSDTLLEPESRTIFRSKRNFEPSFGFQWIFNKNLVGGFGPFVSIDARHKAIYDYNKPGVDAGEDKQFSWNILGGIRKQGAIYKKGIPEFYFRFYHGVNPHGQFRNQRNYTLLGFGVHFTV